MTNKKEKLESTVPMPFSLSSLFLDKSTYAYVANEFHAYHKHTGNVAVHLFTTVMGVWGMIQLALWYDEHAIYNLRGYFVFGRGVVATYAAIVVLTTPSIRLSTLHTILILCLPSARTVLSWLPETKLAISFFGAAARFEMTLTELHLCLAAIVLGYGLQDLAHYLACEPTYLGSYLYTQPWMLGLHSLWLLPLVLEACEARSWFLSHLFVPKKRIFAQASVASTQAVFALNTWIVKNVPETLETTHIWPHQHAGTDEHVSALEKDAAILAGFRSIFPAAEYDILPVVAMNEIYVTAVGSKQDINSDAVFYTPHVDGPYWWLPGLSLYRVLVATTENSVVRTRFNLQHGPTNDCVLTLPGVLGFDYNRELHWIDHVQDSTPNQDRRSLIKLHFCVYPKGWKSYGDLGAHLNATYNTWARGNFLQTLRPVSAYDFALAWWIWLTTYTNALLEEYIGWTNVVYAIVSYMLTRVFHQPWIFIIATSFRHYAMYLTTFHFRDNVAHGVLMRDAKLYKIVSMLQLIRCLAPFVQWKSLWTASTTTPTMTPIYLYDGIALLVAALGFGLTLLATIRLGMVRTYFGTELGLVEPKYITAFPYGTIPHPMIMGQIWGLAVILITLYSRLPSTHVTLLGAHIGCYTMHMVQEMLTSAY